MTAMSNRYNNFYVSTRQMWRRLDLSRKLAFTLAALAVASCIATVAIMTGWQNTPDPDTVLALLYLDAVL
jgi:hypothetical protein